MRSLPVIMASLLLSNCHSRTATTEIIPCKTSINDSDLNNTQSMREFLKRAVPVGSGVDCMKSVMQNSYFNNDENYYINVGKGRKQYSYNYKEKWHLRLKMYLLPEDSQTQIYFHFNGIGLRRTA